MEDPTTITSPNTVGAEVTWKTRSLPVKPAFQVNSALLPKLLTWLSRCWGVHTHQLCVVGPCKNGRAAHTPPPPPSHVEATPLATWSNPLLAAPRVAADTSSVPLRVAGSSEIISSNGVVRYRLPWNNTGVASNIAERLPGLPESSAWVWYSHTGCSRPTLRRSICLADEYLCPPASPP